MHNKSSLFPAYRTALLVTDVVLAVVSFWLGARYTGWHVYLDGVPGATPSLAVLSLTMISFFQTYHLYNYHFLFTLKEHLRNLFKAYCWSLLTLTIIIFMLSSSELLASDFRVFSLIILAGAVLLLLLSRYLWDHLIDFLAAFGIALLIVGIMAILCGENIPVFLTSTNLLLPCFLFAVLLLTAGRIFLFHIVYNRWFRRSFRRQVVIVGSDDEADLIARQILKHNAPFWILGTIGPQLPSTGYNGEKISKGSLGRLEDLAAIVNRLSVDDIIITDRSIDKPTLVSILDFCTSARINAWFSPKSLPIINIKLRPNIFCGLPMILLGAQKRIWLFEPLKHSIDVLITLPLLLLLSPLFFVIILAIKLDSRGPIFYRAKAIGKDGSIFSMLKFRSMRVDADHDIHRDYVSKLIKGEIGKDGNRQEPLKLTRDPRITRVGKFLRKWSLDELPQLINVIKGDMSLVGPRPCLPYEFEMYQDWCKKRTAVRGGITGLWQIAGRSEVAFDDMVLLDLYYIYNRTITLDFNILFETVFVVLGKKGAF